MYGCKRLILCKAHLHKLLDLHILQLLLCILTILIQLNNTFKCLFCLLVLLEHKSTMHYFPNKGEGVVPMMKRQIPTCLSGFGYWMSSSYLASSVTDVLQFTVPSNTTFIQNYISVTKTMLITKNKFYCTVNKL